MDAAAVAAILRSVRATAEADPAGALPTLIATVGVVVAPLQAFGAAAELGGSGFSDACALDALAILAVLLARSEGRAAAQAHGVEATVRAIAEERPFAAPAVRAAAAALLGGLDGAAAAPAAASAAAAAAAAAPAVPAPRAGPLRAVQLRMEGLLGAGRASRADEDRYVAALLQASSVDVTSVTVDARRELCVCYTREPEPEPGAAPPLQAPLRARLYAVVQRGRTSCATWRVASSKRV